MKKFFAIVTFALVSQLTIISSANAADATKYKNCSALNKKYPGGIKKSTGKDMTKKKGKLIPASPKKTPTVDDALFAINKKLDADKDGVACEK